MFSYLIRRKQRVKINDKFNEWLEVTFGIPQGSILGPLLFNIFGSPALPKGSYKFMFVRPCVRP